MTRTMDKVTCRECLRRRDYELTVSLRRQGGGTYRRAGRSYRGSYCVSCLEAMSQWLPTQGDRIRTGDTHSRISVSSILEAIAEFIERGVSDLDEERWRAQWSPTGHHEEFDDYFPRLRHSVEEWLTRRAAFRAERAARFRGE